MKTLSILTLITGLISSTLYGTITTESIINNFVEHKETLSLNDFEFVKKNTHPTLSIYQSDKAIYKSKTTGKLWMINHDFAAHSFREYTAGDLYRLALGNRAPELRLIKDSEGKLMLGSEFIPQFQSLVDFFDPAKSLKNARTLKKCFPTGCSAKQFEKPLQITGGEDIMALMILLGELDGNAANLGLIPSSENPQLYEVGKIDNEDVLCGFVTPMTLRSLAKIVFGEGKSYYTDFDYEKFDLNKIADAFDAIADVPDDIWGETIACRMRELTQENINEEIQSYTAQAELFKKMLNFRKNQCKDFALSLRCEAAVRSNDFQAILNLIEQGFDVNTPVEYIHLDTVKKKQVASLVQLWAIAVQGSQEAMEYFEKYSQQNGPISILEMAVRYNKLELVKQLTPLSNTTSIGQAGLAAIDLKNQEIFTYLASYVSEKGEL